jgi:hypothetical protein
MKSPPRGALARLAVLSLILAVATTLVWARSYWIGDWWISYQTGNSPMAFSDSWQMSCTSGGVNIWHGHEELPGATENEVATRFTHQHIHPVGYPYLNFSGSPNSVEDFRLGSFELFRTRAGRNHQESVTFPLLAVVLLSLVLPLIGFRQRRKLALARPHDKLSTQD